MSLAGMVIERRGGGKSDVDTSCSCSSSYCGLRRGEVEVSESESVGTKPMPGVRGVWVRAGLVMESELRRQERHTTPVRRIRVPRAI